MIRFFHSSSSPLFPVFFYLHIHTSSFLSLLSFLFDEVFSCRFCCRSRPLLYIPSISTNPIQSSYHYHHHTHPPLLHPFTFHCAGENHTQSTIQFQLLTVTHGAMVEVSDQFKSTTVPHISTIGISADFCSITVNAYSSRK